MKKCTACQKEIDEKATICPYCRSKQLTKPVKVLSGIIFIVIVFLVIKTIVGVSKSVNTPNTNGSTSTPDSYENSAQASFMGMCKEKFDDTFCSCINTYVGAHYSWAQMLTMGASSSAGQRLIATATSACKSTPTQNIPSTPSQKAPVSFDINGFPMDYENVTVAQLAKVPSSYTGKKLEFACDVASFIKNDNGDATSFNCADPLDYGSMVQVNGDHFDFTKINQGDTVRIYGLGKGAVTGQNAYGGDVTESVLDGMFVNDLNSGYNNAK